MHNASQMRSCRPFRLTAVWPAGRTVLEEDQKRERGGGERRARGWDFCSTDSTFTLAPCFQR